MKELLITIALMLLMGCETAEKEERLHLTSEQATELVMSGYHIGRTDPNGIYADSVAVRNIFIKNFNK